MTVHEAFATVVRPLLTAVRPTTVLEVGAGQGRLTRWLIQHSGATVHAVDPAPALDPDVLDVANGRLVVHPARSLTVIRTLLPVDLAILDGDPNWYTVINELRLLAGGESTAGQTQPVVVLHNVDWPFGRRDGYYDPDAIPEAWRAPNASLGVLPGHRTASDDGLALVPFVALEDRLPNSGVRTALEDFLAESPEPWRFVEIPGLHGIGVLASVERLRADPKLSDVLDAYQQPDFLTSQLDAIERGRIAALIRSTAARIDDERVDALQARVELLERDRDARLRAAAHGQDILRIDRASIEVQNRAQAAERELEDKRGDLAEAMDRVTELEQAIEAATKSSEARHAELQHELDSARAENERLAEDRSSLLHERSVLREYADRAATSHAWRIGHRLSSLARLLTFRGSLGTNALDRLRERLASSPLQLPPGDAHDTTLELPEDPPADS